MAATMAAAASAALPPSSVSTWRPSWVANGSSLATARRLTSASGLSAVPMVPPLTNWQPARDIARMPAVAARHGRRRDATRLPSGPWRRVRGNAPTGFGAPAGPLHSPFDRHGFREVSVRKRLTRMIVGLVMVAAQAVPAQAQGSITFIRDAETEAVLRELARPVFQAAGVVPAAVDLHIVNDNVVNAFVTGGQNIFFTTGFLIESESALEVLGVIAHETGHIAGGHLARGADAVEDASTRAIIATLVGLAAAIATGSGELAAVSSLGGGAVRPARPAGVQPLHGERRRSGRPHVSRSDRRFLRGAVEFSGAA
jgi:hypothetical protein